MLRLECELQRGAAAGEEPWSTLSRAVEYRRQCTGLTETGLWALDLMQGDLGYAAITAAVGDVIRDTTPTVPVAAKSQRHSHTRSIPSIQFNLVEKNPVV